jgi:Asp-tRNA(Asn)/Glu-tRNA(Gln) amidotransferase A subunit family amidase
MPQVRASTAQLRRGFGVRPGGRRLLLLRARSRRMPVPQADEASACAAAMIITASEASNLHLADLKTRAKDFDPLTRDRFLADALAPTTPWPAPPIGARTTVVGGVDVFTRSHLGVFTQPLSFIGLPVISVPVTAPGALPLGVQLVAGPICEASLFRVAAHPEAAGVL